MDLQLLKHRSQVAINDYNRSMSPPGGDILAAIVLPPVRWGARTFYGLDYCSRSGAARLQLGGRWTLLSACLQESIRLALDVETCCLRARRSADLVVRSASAR